MACKKCDHKGYLESFIRGWNGDHKIIKQCESCRDTAAYSKRVLERVQEIDEMIRREIGAQPPKPELRLIVDNSSEKDWTAVPRPKPELKLIKGGKL